jgi:hypothetical protein
MLKKTIKYVDFNNVERTEDFYFNLNKSEIQVMEMSTEGGLVEKINRIVAHIDGAEIMKIFQEVIFKAYGEKSPDGRQFVKSEALSIAFSQTPAYDILFQELVTNPEKAAEFINAITPPLPAKTN